MEATLWDGDLIAGPVPTLFTEEVEAGTKAILEVKFDKFDWYGGVTVLLPGQVIGK